MVTMVVLTVLALPLAVLAARVGRRRWVRRAVARTELFRHWMPRDEPSVAIVTSPATYDAVLAAVAAGGFTLAERQRLAAEAFVHTATYDVHVASWMGNVLTDTSDGTGFPAWVGGTYDQAAVLRYGENPHQPAALYTSGHGPGGLAAAQQQGNVGVETANLRGLNPSNGGVRTLVLVDTRRFVPTTHRFDGQKLFTKENGKRFARNIARSANNSAWSASDMPLPWSATVTCRPPSARVSSTVIVEPSALTS